MTQEMQYVDVSYVSKYGKIRSCWRKSDGKEEMEVEIPANTTALIFLPGVREKGAYEGNCLIRQFAFRDGDKSGTKIFSEVFHCFRQKYGKTL